MRGLRCYAFIHKPVAARLRHNSHQNNINRVAIQTIAAVWVAQSLTPTVLDEAQACLRSCALLYHNRLLQSGAAGYG